MGVCDRTQQKIVRSCIHSRTISYGNRYILIQSCHLKSILSLTNRYGKRMTINHLRKYSIIQCIQSTEIAIKENGTRMRRTVPVLISGRNPVPCMTVNGDTIKEMDLECTAYHRLTEFLPKYTQG